MKSVFISCSLDCPDDDFLVSVMPAYLVGWDFIPTICYEHRIQSFDTYKAICNADLFVGVITIEERANTVWREYLLARSLNIPSLILIDMDTVPPHGMEAYEAEGTIFRFDRNFLSIYRAIGKIRDFFISTFDSCDREKIHTWSAGCYFLMDLLIAISSEIPCVRTVVKDN